MSIPQVGGYGYELPYQYYQNQLWQNPYMMNYGLYGMNMPTFCAAPTADTYQPKVSQVSANQEIKQNDNTKKSGMSKGAKWLLGIAGTAATVYGGCALHKHFKLTNMQKNFSEIFRKNFTKDETKALIKNYDDIMKIENFDEFCEKAFLQVKKDYGYENKNILLKVNKISNDTLKGEAGGGWSIVDGRIELRPYIKNGQTANYNDKKSVIDTLIHEFQHVKQSEIEYRTSSKKLLEILRQRNEIPTGEALQKELNKMKEILNDNARLTSWANYRGQTVEALTKDIEGAIYNGNYKPFDTFDEKVVSKNLEDIFGSFKKFDSNSPDYQKGLKYLDNEANYIDAHDDKNGYLHQIIEKEAYGAEHLFNKIWEYIKS